MSAGMELWAVLDKHYAEGKLSVYA